MFKRGEIYYVSIPRQTGTEMAKDRPAVIVSSDDVNTAYGHVMVCYLTSCTNYDTRRERVTIRSTGRVSAVVCEQVTTVDKSRLREFLGSCTWREMEQIESGIMAAMQLLPPDTGREADERIARLEGEIKAYRTILGERGERGTIGG